VAGLVTNDQGAIDAAVAWVGGRRLALVDEFERGAQSIDRTVQVLRSWSRPDAARCKETALDAIMHGASVVFAGSGPCAEGALAAAGDQNAIGLALLDFERPEIAVAQVVRDALLGLYHGGENIVFGADSGAIGIARLDPRVSPEAAAQAHEAEQELAAGLRSPG
jgi:hypothetical protein